MSEERYPAELAVAKQDFDDCGWKEALSHASQDGYSSMWQALSAAARQAMKEGREKDGKVLWLLADACSMKLAPTSMNTPFKPLMVMEGRRSAHPEDFSESDVTLFAEIVDSVDEVWLKARLADLVWFKQPKREVRFALAAIDAYRLIPLDTQTWVRGGRECWARAIQLARMLKAQAGGRLAEIEATVFAAFENSAKEDGFLALSLADLLEPSRSLRDQSATIAEKLELLAHQFDGVGDHHSARKYFGAAAKYWKRVGNAEKSAAMTANEAEGWAKEAIARAADSNPSYMAVASQYEQAIQVYRTIPRAQRTQLHADERLDELLANLREAGEKSTAEMVSIATPAVDISLLVEQARKAVSSQTPVNALKAFCGLYQGVDAAQARVRAVESLARHPLQGLFQSTTVTHDGRVISKRPGLQRGEVPSPDNEATISAEMVRDHGILIGLIVQGIVDASA